VILFKWTKIDLGLVEELFALFLKQLESLNLVVMKQNCRRIWNKK